MRAGGRPSGRPPLLLHRHLPESIPCRPACASITRKGGRDRVPICRGGPLGSASASTTRCSTVAISKRKVDAWQRDAFKAELLCHSEQSNRAVFQANGGLTHTHTKFAVGL